MAASLGQQDTSTTSSSKFLQLQLYTNFPHCSSSHCNLPPPDNKKKLLTCSNCASAAYHNPACQRSHWKVHKRSCKLLSKSLLPLRELICWSDHFNHLMEQQRRRHGDGRVNSNEQLLMQSSWWLPNNTTINNGITSDTLRRTNHIWNVAVEHWNEQEYLRAMEEMQLALEAYQHAWKMCVASERLEVVKNGDGEILRDGVGSNRQIMNDEEDGEYGDFFETSMTLTRRLLFLSYCELDGGQIASARHRLVQCISIANTMLYFSSFHKLHNKQHTNQSAQSLLDDAYMELMLSMEEVESDKILARHVANLAIGNGNCCGWVDPMQRPGYMSSRTIVKLSSVPICPLEERPTWCNELEKHYDKILEEYNNTSRAKLWMDVGCGQRGSGHDDHSVVSGRGWKEYVLFGTGALESDNDAPFTKQLLRKHVPDAVTLAREGGGEVIFSRLSPKTHIKPHCGPTNLRWTAHLGLVIPKSKSDCRIRVGNEWISWSAGKILVFDDSFEHEVKNDTDEERVVLLIRLWHPELMSRTRLASQLVEEAIGKKEESVQKRYHPPT